jgi:hypothetical protein
MNSYVDPRGRITERLGFYDYTAQKKPKRVKKQQTTANHIVDTETGRVYVSAADASGETGVSESAIWNDTKLGRGRFRRMG